MVTVMKLFESIYITAVRMVIKKGNYLLLYVAVLLLMGFFFYHSINYTVILYSVYNFVYNIYFKKF
jgi:hypothetical protein